MMEKVLGPGPSICMILINPVLQMENGDIYT